MKDINDYIGKIIQGDALEVLKSMPDEFVDCVVTSPPYWGLRDYGVAGQLGREKTFNEYIIKLCDIFDEVRRVLKPSGTCWVNIGDSYASEGGASRHYGYQDPKYKNGRNGSFIEPSAFKQVGALPKSLCQIPERFSIEMANRGWIKRNTIIWHKPNCMPASVTDRFTVDFEYLYFFVKNKKYWFEQQFKKYSESFLKDGRWRTGATDINLKSGYDEAKAQNPKNIHGNIFGKRKTKIPFEFAEKMGSPRGRQHRMPPIGGIKRSGGDNPVYSGNTPEWKQQGSNMRCVWDITTKGFSGAHFAVFPEALPKRCISAGCPANGVVLDPFSGAGTTCLVAKKLDRQYVGIELNLEFCRIAQERIDRERAQGKLGI